MGEKLCSEAPDGRRLPWCVTGRGNCMPPLGPKDGENTEVREGDDSVCLKEWRPPGVGGTISMTLLEKDLSSPGV